jgi:hypothetical protein
MTWAQLRRLFLQATGSTPDAMEETWVHLSYGQRRVANTPGIDVPELYKTVTVTAPTGIDYIPLANLGVDVFSIASGQNISRGYPIYPENSGMMGRMKYLQPDTNQPPLGQVSNYERDSDSIWLRNTPDEDTLLAFRVMIQVPELDESDINDSPLLPEHVQMAIVQAATANYYSLHREENTVMGANGQPAGLHSTRFENQFLATISQPKSSRAEEDRPRRQTMRLAGYQIGPKSRR